MYLDVYIGELDDPSWSWDGKDAVGGNCPRRVGPFFPSARRLFYQIIQEIETGELAGKKVDWGGYVADVTGTDIALLVEEYYGDREDFINRSLPHLQLRRPPRRCGDLTGLKMQM